MKHILLILALVLTSALRAETADSVKLQSLVALKLLQITAQQEFGNQAPAEYILIADFDTSEGVYISKVMFICVRKDLERISSYLVYKWDRATEKFVKRHFPYSKAGEALEFYNNKFGERF